MRLPASIRFEGDRTLVAETTDISATGVGLRVPKGLQIDLETHVALTLYQDDQECTVSGRVAKWSGDAVGILLDPMSVDDEKEFVKFTFARADAWVTTWGTSAQDAPLRALRDVISLGGEGLVKIMRFAWVDKVPAWLRLMKRKVKKTVPERAAT
jgi:cellulose synthase (UDP-forming)